MPRNKKIRYKPESSRSNRSHGSIKIKGLIGVVLIGLVLVLSVFFGVRYVQATLDSYKGVNIKDPVSTGDRLLFDQNPGVQKTLFIFETARSGGGNEILSLYLVVKNRDTASTAVFLIPGWVYISLEAETGLATVTSIRNLLYLSDLVSPESPYQYFVWEIQNALGVQIDDYVWVKEGANSAFSTRLKLDRDDSQGLGFLSRFLKVTQLASLLTSQRETSTILKNVYSDQSPVGLYRLTREIQADLQQPELDFVDISSDEYLVEKTLDSGETVNMFNQVESDRKISELDSVFVDRSIEREQAKVEVYNGSDIDGLASRYSRVISNAGLPIVRSENSPTDYNESVIYISRIDKFAASLELVKSLLPVDVSVVEGRPDFLTTADIMVILGDDVAVEYLW